MLLNRLRKLKLNEDDEGNDLTTNREKSAITSTQLLVTNKTMQGKIVDVSEGERRSAVFITDANEVGILWKYPKYFTDEFLKKGNTADEGHIVVTKDYENTKMNLYIKYPNTPNEFSDSFVEDNTGFGDLETVEAINIEFEKLTMFGFKGRRALPFGSINKVSAGIINIKRGGIFRDLVLVSHRGEQRNFLALNFASAKLTKMGIKIQKEMHFTTSYLSIKNMVNQRMVLKNNRLYSLQKDRISYYPLLIDREIDGKKITSIKNISTDDFNANRGLVKLLEVDNDYILISLVDSFTGELMLYASSHDGRNGKRYTIKHTLTPPATYDYSVDFDGEFFTAINWDGLELFRADRFLYQINGEDNIKIKDLSLGKDISFSHTPYKGLISDNERLLIAHNFYDNETEEKKAQVHIFSRTDISYPYAMVNGYEMREGTDDEKIKEWTHIIKGIGTILVGLNDNEKSNVYEIDRYTYQNSGTLTTNEILIGDPTKKKSIRQIYCLVKIKPNTEVRVEYSLDGSETFNEAGNVIGEQKQEKK